jgi:hypothetical protein
MAPLIEVRGRRATTLGYRASRPEVAGWLWTRLWTTPLARLDGSPEARQAETLAATGLSKRFKRASMEQLLALVGVYW